MCVKSLCTCPDIILKPSRKDSSLVLLSTVLEIDKAGASLVAQMVKNQPATQETRVRFLSQEDPQKKG